MLTAIVQIWLMATCALLVIVCVQDWRRERRRAIEAGKRAAEQAYAACKARAAGEAAKQAGTIGYLKSVGQAEIEKNSRRGVPTRIDYLRTPAEMMAIRERIISESSVSIAEIRARRAGQN